MATILLVEDDANTRDLYRTILESAGHDVHEAADGQEGLRSALALEPRLVILDLGLPIMAGDGLLARLRDLPCGQDLKILVVTGFDPDVAMDRLPRDGADGLVLKPVEPRALVQHVDACLADRPVWPHRPSLSAPTPPLPPAGEEGDAEAQPRLDD